MNANDLAKTVMARIVELAGISEERGKLTRTFCSPAMKQVNGLVAIWMRDAGMAVAEDAVGNLIGRYTGQHQNAKTFLLGSHLDTVRDAGKFDGPLGVLVAIACVEALHAQKIRLPFALEVVGFADEEGVRYQTTYLGSKTVAGIFNPADLQRVDAHGVAMSDAVKSFGGDPAKIDSARRNSQQLLGYAEVHIEQGPVLEKKQQPVGVVTAIAGQTRVKVAFIGHAGHAGTTPMALRQDALVAAAEFVVAVETHARSCMGLVATVGQMEVLPGASNVIPGKVLMTLDVRHAEDSFRQNATSRLQEMAHEIARTRQIQFTCETVHEAASTPCSSELSALLAKAARQHLLEVTELPSGAGHDAAVLGQITPMAMLFVRCKGGISHHPDESATVEDIAVAIAVMNDFLHLLANEPPQKNA